ncbi:MAG: SDR family NAD(P)-dependent oxidoreductase [Candidatus Nanoarchaeia archaeon]|nr:SDR family NAD(P)-dependent oxidoreductase [Candidatus Nanoarchaeia archaeon]MDD5239273.1 SDR family NAD(P)-dependent oxidoreductase [Candidatus Nanoarchaeia archaeon]
MNKTFWKNKNVLVTGGSGFIGGHLVEALVGSGANVFVVDINNNPDLYYFKEGLNKKSVFLNVNVQDSDKVFEAVTKNRIEIVFHLAAQPLVGKAIVNPVEVFKTNIDGSINVLETVRANKNVKALVIVSSDKAYGESKILPYTEDMPLKGECPYSVSKSCEDLIANTYFKIYDLPIVITRFANVYGPGDLNLSRIVPGAITTMIKNETLEIRSDGKQIREYLFVKDVVNGLMMLVENIQKTKGHAYNFGSGKRFSVIELVNKIGEVAKQKINFKILNIAKGEIPEQYLSYEKIKKHINWEPIHSFESGLKETLDWYKKVIQK